jgi:hypothetical protein
MGIEKGGDRLARFRPGGGRDRVLEVEDQGVRARFQRLLHPVRPVAGHEQERAQSHSRPRCIKGGALHHADQLVALIVHAVLEGDDAGVGTGFRILEADHLGLGAQRVADEDRLGHAHLVVAEIGDERAQGGVADRQADQQREVKVPLTTIRPNSVASA